MMMYNQRIHATGTPDEIFQSADPIVRKFIDGVSDTKELYF
jgi:ABC-type transporter Mla maintaining outer membrane lipid asymmetry ATPase subunit MlaF